MNNSDSNKKIQELTVSLLKVFINICEEHNLCYYFMGGSLIGVLRHKGFIPWDDDIDVGMPRKDYDKFIKVVQYGNFDGYGICNRYTDKNWHFAMSQFIDLKSEIQIDLAETPRLAHIWIDVFPLDGLPSNKLAKWIRVKNVLFHRYLVQIAHIDTQVDVHRQRPLLEKIVLLLFKILPVGKLLNSNSILDHMEKILRKTDFSTAEYAANMLGRYREKEVVPQKYFGTPKKGIFEDTYVNIPEMSHELQTSVYGDYMKLPPECQRETHNVKIIKCRNIL